MGFGKELWGFNDKSGTRWKVCAIPLGGYVRMLGDADAASATESEEVKKLSEEELKRTFTAQAPSKKLAITLAGPAANYLFAILNFYRYLFLFGAADFSRRLSVRFLTGGLLKLPVCRKMTGFLKLTAKKLTLLPICSAKLT